MVSLRSGTVLSPAPTWEIYPVGCSTADGPGGSASVLIQTEPLILDELLRTPPKPRTVTTDAPLATICRQSEKEAGLDGEADGQGSVAKEAGSSVANERPDEAIAALGCETGDHEVAAKEIDGAPLNPVMVAAVVGGNRDIIAGSVVKPGDATSSPALDHEARVNISCDSEADAEPIDPLNAMSQIIAQQLPEGSLERVSVSDRGGDDVSCEQGELTEDWDGDRLSEQHGQPSKQASTRKRSKDMLSGDGTSESPHIIEETLRRSKRKKLTVTSYIDTENLWMSSTTTNLFGAVKGLEKMIKLLETQSGVISDGALMTNMAISRICKQQMESLKGLIEYISRCGTEEEKYTKNWKAL